jgi:hypothetical protein
MLFPAVAREVFLSSPSLKMRLLTNCNNARLVVDLLIYFDSVQSNMTITSPVSLIFRSNALCRLLT